MQSLAYEYAKRGACLVLAARRERSLQEVAERAHDLGSPDVVVILADVSKMEDCRRVVDQTMNHFGRCKMIVFSLMYLRERIKIFVLTFILHLQWIIWSITLELRQLLCWKKLTMLLISEQLWYDYTIMTYFATQSDIVNLAYCKKFLSKSGLISLNGN